MRLVALLLVLATSSVAAAEPDVAFAVNQPFGWAEGTLGASGYFALAKHHALRANVATYQEGATGEVVASVLFGGDDESIRKGRITDAGLSYVLFANKFCDGFFLELGALVRARDTYREDDFATPAIVDTDTTTIAGRGMIGWSWTISDSLFISLAVGLSGGHERGQETTAPFAFDPDRMRTTADVSRTTFEAEGFLRIGAMFDR
jgi:hypothetical protein